MRTVLCTLLALAVAAGSLIAADEDGKKKKKKKGTGVTGQVVKVDAEAGTITLKVQVKKKQTEEKEYKVTDKTTVTEVKGDEKTELKVEKVADLLKKDQFKEGTTLTIEPDEDGKTAKSVTIGTVAKKKKKNKKDA